MKKILIFILLSLFTVNVSGQNKKAAKKLDVVEQWEIIEKKAKVWFKNVYVQNFFKDPYSYKLMKCSAAPVFKGEKIEKRINELKKNIAGDEYIKNNKPHMYNDRWRKRRAEFDIELSALEEKYNAMSESEKKDVDFYRVYIDCYSKNSFGNKVLGRFVFTSDKDGNFDLNSVTEMNN